LESHVTVNHAISASIQRYVRRTIDLSPDVPDIYVCAAQYGALNRTPTCSNGLLTSWGKGLTRDKAKSSAVYEALEHISSFYRRNERDIMSSYVELGDAAIEPNACMLYSAEQYAQRSDFKKEVHGLYVPHKLNPSEKISWTPIRSLITSSIKYIPTAYCYFACDQPGSAYCAMDSNGHAVGNSIEDALVHGLLELIERDAVGIWWYNNLSAVPVDLSSFDNKYFDAVEAYYATLGQDVFVLEITTDINIPTFVAITRAKDDKNNIRLGYSAHVHAERAIERALAELHMWFALPNTRYERPAPQIYPIRFTAADGVPIDIQDINCLKINEDIAAKTVDDYLPDYPAGTMEYLPYCQKQIEEVGLDLLFLDLTLPDIAVPAVKVIVPGLRHYKRRLAKGRLFNVPLQQHRLDSVCTEEMLNPFSLVN